VFAGVSSGACGLRDLGIYALQGPFLLSPGTSSLAPSRVKYLKSASTKISLVTNQRVTRGLFKRLDGIIAYPEEITNPKLPWAQTKRRCSFCVFDRAVDAPC
jgi:hypothetical protein